MTAFLGAGLCLVLSSLIVAGLDRMCRRAPLIELMRFRGNDHAVTAYRARLKAAGLAPVRNVRDAIAPPLLLLTHEKES